MGRKTKWDRAEKDILKQENDVLKQEKDVLKQENDVQKQEIWSFFKEEFVPAHMLLPPGTKGHQDKNFVLSRDKGTTGRPVLVCPGLSRGTFRPVETLIGSIKSVCF